jgi:hypothetical protein
MIAYQGARTSWARRSASAKAARVGDDGLAIADFYIFPI